MKTRKANNSNTQRNSIIDMMGILGKLEDDINKQTGSTEKAKLEVRNSIVGMMDLLANLESKELNTGVGKTNAKTKKNPKIEILGCWYDGSISKFGEYYHNKR